MSQIEIHAAAMKQTADFYDDFVSTPTKETPLYSRNSLNPSWIVEGCLFGGGEREKGKPKSNYWGRVTDLTEHARVVRDSYMFGGRTTTRIYPAIETSEGGVTEFSFQFYESKSLVFKTQMKANPEPEVMDRFGAGKFPLDPSDLMYKNREELEQERVGTQKRKAKVKKTERFLCGRRVSDAELNAQYAEYVAGTATEESTVAMFVEFARWKLTLGERESNLSLLEQDQVLSKFMEKILRVLRNQMYSGRDGKPFSNYLKAIWTNTRSDGYGRQSRTKRLFERSRFVLADDPEEQFHVSQEDAASFKIYTEARPDQDREDAQLVLAMKSHLSATDIAIWEQLSEDSFQTEVALRLGISRHEVDRAKKRVEKAGRRALVRMALAKGAA